MTPIFATRRAKPPVLVLTAAMERDALQADYKRALATNRRDVPRIEAEARAQVLRCLRMGREVVSA